MTRNSGLIGTKKNISSLDATGVHDTFDNYNAMKDDSWPMPIAVSYLSISFDNTSTTSNYLWGDTISITVNGSGLTTLYYTMNVTSGSNSTSYWLDGSINGQLSGNTLSQTFSKRLKFQTAGVSSFTFTFQFRTGSTTGPIIATSAPITVAQLIYDITMPIGNEGSNYYYKPNFSGLTTSGTAYFGSPGSSFTSSEWSSQYTRYYYGYQANGATSQNHGILSKDLTTEGNSHSAGYMRVRFQTNVDQSYNYVSFTKNGSGSASINQYIYVNDTSLTPTVTISDTAPNEGDTITITVQALTPSGTQFNVAIVNTTATATDYGVLSATTISMNSSAGGGQYYGQFSHTISRDFVTEGNESFYYQITAVEDGSPHNSPTVTIQDTTTLSNITVSTNSINEGSSVTFTVNTIGAISGQTYPYYYRMKSNTGFMGSHDFTDGLTNGSFTISGTSNSGSFTKTLASDGYTEGTEVIKAEVGPTSSGPWTSSPTVSVADTSSGATEPTNTFLISKNLTGTQGYTMYTNTVTKDMATSSARTIPVGYNPRTGNSLLPTGSRSQWSDWGGDWFDSWGDWYVYNPTSQTAQYIVFTNKNGADGTIYTETQTIHSKTFQIKHGYVAQGIFKLDVACTSDDAFEFAVGMYGNMGSDGSTQNQDHTYTNPSWGTLHYNRNSQSTTGEWFYTHIIPKNKADNDTFAIDTTGMFTSVQGNDYLCIWTAPFTHGFTMYFVKGSNITTGAMYNWIANDIETNPSTYYN